MKHGTEVRALEIVGAPGDMIDRLSHLIDRMRRSPGADDRATRTREARQRARLDDNAERAALRYRLMLDYARDHGIRPSVPFGVQDLLEGTNRSETLDSFSEWPFFPPSDLTFFRDARCRAARVVAQPTVAAFDRDRADIADWIRACGLQSTLCDRFRSWRSPESRLMLVIAPASA